MIFWSRMKDARCFAASRRPNQPNGREGASIASKVKWGILSTANIGVKRVIPAIIAGQRGVVYGVASRDAEPCGEHRRALRYRPQLRQLPGTPGRS